MVKVAELKKISCLQNLQSDDLASIAARVISKTYEPDEVISFEGSQCRGLKFVLSGRVKVFKTSEEGREHIFYLARPGDAFCEMNIFDEGPSLLSASAVVTSEIYSIPISDIRNLINKIPELAIIMLRLFSDRLKTFVGLVEDLSFKNVPERLAKILLEIIDREGATSGANVILKRNITLYEMASLIGTVREVITRSLQKLEKSGILKVDRNKIEVLNIDKLREIAGGEPGFKK